MQQTQVLPDEPATLDAPAPPAIDSHQSPGAGLWLRRAAFAALTAGCLGGWLSPAAALACGAGFALILGNPFARHTPALAKQLLQACVVLLGFQMDFPLLVRTGAEGWLLASLSIALVLGTGWALGRALRIQRKLSMLISAGTAICGGSAIAAVGPVIDATAAEMTVAMGTVFMLNAVALYAFPLIGHALHLTQEQFGLWAGIGIHDISSVVGAAAAYGDRALQVAAAVKLSRTLWIVPICLGAAAHSRAQKNAHVAARGKVKIKVPWFIALFVLASLARWWVPGVAGHAEAIGTLARHGLGATLFLVGTGLTRCVVRTVGWRALLEGVGLWLLVAAVSLGMALAG